MNIENHCSPYLWSLKKTILPIKYLEFDNIIFYNLGRNINMYLVLKTTGRNLQMGCGKTFKLFVCVFWVSVIRSRSPASLVLINYVLPPGGCSHWLWGQRVRHWSHCGAEAGVHPGSLRREGACCSRCQGVSRRSVGRLILHSDITPQQN